MDNVPGMTAIIETEEAQLWASGPNGQDQRFDKKVDIKSTVTDSGNSPTTTLRAGKIMAVKTSDGMAYAYSATASDGTQVPVGVVPRYLNMLDKQGTAIDHFSRVLASGWLKDPTTLAGVDLEALAVLFRNGFRSAAVDPHGSAFGLHFKGRYFKNGTTLTNAYTVVVADHGCELVAITDFVNFTLPDLATVGRGFQVMIYNAVDASSVITAAANTIVFGDAGGAVSTSITFSTANKKMGGQALMISDYGTDGTTLMWYAKFPIGGTFA